MLTLVAISMVLARNVISPVIVALPMRLMKAPPELFVLMPLPPKPAVPVMLMLPAPVASTVPPKLDAASESNLTPLLDPALPAPVPVMLIAPDAVVTLAP